MDLMLVWAVKKLRIIRVENSDGDSLGGTIMFNYLLLNNYVGVISQKYCLISHFVV